jgi:hypothetical protein
MTRKSKNVKVVASSVNSRGLMPSLPMVLAPKYSWVQVPFKLMTATGAHPRKGGSDDMVEEKANDWNDGECKTQLPASFRTLRFKTRGSGLHRS